MYVTCSLVLTCVGLSVAGTKTSPAGHGGTRHINITFHVITQRTSVFAREERWTNAFRNPFKMSDWAKPPHCAVQFAFFPRPHT